MPNVSNSSAPMGPYPPRDTYADDSGDAPCGPSSDVIGPLDSPIFVPLNLGHSNTEAGGYWFLDAGGPVATSKDMNLEADPLHSRRIMRQAKLGGTRFTWPGRDPVASDLPRRRTDSFSKWSNYQEVSKAAESLDGLVDGQSTTRDVSEHASSQLMRGTVNPTGLDDLQRNKPNIADERDEMRRAYMAYTAKNRRASQPIPDDLPITRRPVDLSSSAIEHTTESVDGGSRPVTRIGAWNVMERALSIQTKRIRCLNQPVPSDIPVRRRSIGMSTTEMDCARQSTSQTTGSVDDASGSATRARAWNGIEWVVSGPMARVRRVREPVPCDLPVRRQPMEMSITKLECAHQGTIHTTESVDDGSESVTRVRAWNGLDRAISGSMARIRRANEPVPSDLPVRRRSMDIPITELECARQGISHITESVDNGSGPVTRARAWNGMGRAISDPMTRIRRANDPVPSDLPVRRRFVDMSITELECSWQGTSHTTESVDDGSGSVTRVGAWNGMERKHLGLMARIRRANEPVPSDLPVRRRSMDMFITELVCARQDTSHTTESVDDGSGSVTRARAWNGMERAISVATTRIRRTNQPVPSDFPMKRRPLDMSISAIEHSRLGNITKAIDGGCGSRTRAGAWNGMERAHSVSTTSIRHVNDTEPSDLPVRRPAIEIPLTEIRCARLDTSHTTERIDGGSRSNNKAGVWNGMKRVLLVQTARIRRVNRALLNDFPIRRRAFDMPIAAIIRSRLGNSTKDTDGGSGLDIIDNLEGGSIARTSSTLSTSSRRESQSTPNDFPIRCLPLDMPVAATEGARRGTTHTTENIDDERRFTTIDRLGEGRHAYSGATGRFRLNPVPTASDLPRRKSADAYATRRGDINSARGVLIDQTQRGDALDTGRKRNTWSFKSGEPVATDFPRRSTCHAADITENKDALETAKTNAIFWTWKKSQHDTWQMNTSQASPERPPQNSFDFRAFVEEDVKSISRTDGKSTGDSLDESWAQSGNNVNDKGR